MAISDQTRKILWARSGNTCAICKTVLVLDKTPHDSESIIGDECHIVAQSSKGPRGDASYPSNSIDEYDNLILLCKIHHKMIDDQPNTYTVDKLKKLKSEHEDLVKKRGRPNTEQSNSQNNQVGSKILVGIESSQELMSIIAGTHVGSFDHDELQDEYEVEEIGLFLENLQDYCDFWNEIDAMQRTRLSFNLSEQMRKIKELGFGIFATRYKTKFRIGDKDMDWLVSVVKVVRNNNPDIVYLNKDFDSKK